MRPDYDSAIDEYWDGVEEQEAELADRLHKEAQEERAWDYFERRDDDSR